MKTSGTIKYKALFLLVSFSLNSVVGFACSLGVDMGFNSNYPSHGNDKQHEHADAGHQPEHDGTNSHYHQQEVKSHNHSDKQNNAVSFTFQRADDCCKDFVAGFQSMDKMPAKQNSAQQKTTNISPFIPLIADADNKEGFVLHLRIPPREVDYSPPDIRVFIQSFLI
jgi:hypothetical protein